MVPIRFTVCLSVSFHLLLAVPLVVDSLASLSSRRDVLAVASGAIVGSGLAPIIATATDDSPDSVNVDSFLRTGMVSQPMGVSGQAGKSKPETGIVFREGSEMARNSKTGEVVAEILLKDGKKEYVPVVASFSSPWPLGA